jgi:23S rRNA (uracil1939-C5)-methyltransferase
MGRCRKKIPEGEYIADIIGLSHEGRGIAKINNKATFIQFGIPGEKVKFKYTYTRSKFDEGIVTEVIEMSPDRVSPVCEFYENCGGCSLQHLSPGAQVAHKVNTLKEHFQHFGKVAPISWLDTINSEKTISYRTKARLGVRYVAKKDDRVLVGFRERNGRYLADISSCKVLDESVGDNLDKLQELIRSLDSYEKIPQIEVAVDDTKTALIIRHLEELNESDLNKIKNYALEYNYWIYLQSKGPDTVNLLFPLIDKEERYLKYTIPEYNINIHFHPNDFTQVNYSVNQRMILQAIQLMDIKSTDRILDLFCGLGNFTLPLARQASLVLGVEGDDMMVKRAFESAKINRIENVDFYVANLFDETISNHEWASKNCNKMLLDPPRAGAEMVCRNIGVFNPEMIVYISCNPATLARDAGILVNEKGYQMQKAGIMDMFPHTTHVESMALFIK